MLLSPESTNSFFQPTLHLWRILFFTLLPELMTIGGHLHYGTQSVPNCSIHTGKLGTYTVTWLYSGSHVCEWGNWVHMSHQLTTRGLVKKTYRGTLVPSLHRPSGQHRCPVTTQSPGPNSYRQSANKIKRLTEEQRLKAVSHSRPKFSHCGTIQALSYFILSYLN